MSNIDSIIERINNLMAIAENEASSDNEAQMAFERAQKLINEYRIEDWKRDRTRTNKPIIERGVNVSKTTIYHQQGYLATIIAQANECRAYLHESRCGGRIEERAVMFVGEEDDVNAAVILFQSIDLYCSVHARTSYADMIDQHAKAYYEDNKEYVETHYGRESYPTLTECKQYMRRDYPRAKFYNSTPTNTGEPSSTPCPCSPHAPYGTASHCESRTANTAQHTRSWEATNPRD